MELRRKFLISLSLVNELSAVATVMGTVIYIISAVQTSGYVVASDAFSTIEKEAVSLANFKWAIFSLNDILDGEHLAKKQQRDVIRKFFCFNLKIQMRQSI